MENRLRRCLVCWMVAPSKATLILTPRACKCKLIWKRVFADIVKLWILR